MLGILHVGVMPSLQLAQLITLESHLRLRGGLEAIHLLVSSLARKEVCSELRHWWHQHALAYIREN